jgi:hypothetical protein
MCFAWAGRPDRASEMAARAREDAEKLGSHRAVHAAAATVSAMLLPGRLGEMEVHTRAVPDLIVEEGGRTCGNGALALAGRALALFEARRADEAEEVLDVVERHAPNAGPPLYLYTAAEVVRPFVGLERTRDTLDTLAGRERGGAASTALRLRAELQFCAVAGDDERMATMLDIHAELSSGVGKHDLGHIVRWAHAMGMARSGDAEEAFTRASIACGAMSTQMPYLSGRLLADFLPLVTEVDGARDLAEETVQRLDALGAWASADELRAAF